MGASIIKISKTTAHSRGKAPKAAHTNRKEKPIKHIVQTMASPTALKYFFSFLLLNISNSFSSVYRILYTIDQIGV
jgi:hypothetical protein